MMNFTLKSVRSLAATLLFTGSLAGGANAAVLFTIQEVGNDVVVTSTGGSFNLEEATFGATGTATVGDVRITLDTNEDAIYIGSGSTSFYEAALLKPTIPSGVNFNLTAASVAGEFYGIYPAASRLFVPEGYVSGSVLPDSSATFANVSLADMGLSVGDSYTWAWGSGPNLDSATFSAVPEPTSTFLLSLGALALMARRRK